MVRVLTFMGCLLFSPFLGAQSFQTGLISGLRDGAGTPWLWFAATDASPLVGGVVGLEIPPSGGIDPASIRLYGLGWLMTTQDGSTMVLLGAVPRNTFTLSGSWSGLDLVSDPALGFLFTDRYGPWFFGAGAFSATGTIQWASSLPLGEVQGQVRLLFAGVPSFGVFYGDVDLRGQARLDLFGFSPYQGTGSIQLKTVGLWDQVSRSLGDWRWGLALFGGLAWVTEGTISTATQWPEITLSPPSFTVTTSRVDDSLTAHPAWGILIKPEVDWEPRPWGKFSLSRWIPISGGWSFSEGSSVKTAPPSLTAPWIPSRLSTTDLWNLCFAGMEIGYSARW